MWKNGLQPFWLEMRMNLPVLGIFLAMICVKFGQTGNVKKMANLAYSLRLGILDAEVGTQNAPMLTIYVKNPSHGKAPFTFISEVLLPASALPTGAMLM